MDMFHHNYKNTIAAPFLLVQDENEVYFYDKDRTINKLVIYSIAKRESCKKIEKIVDIHLFEMHSIINFVLMDF